MIPIDARDCPRCKGAALVSVLYADGVGYDRDECLDCGARWTNDPPLPTSYAKRPVMLDCPSYLEMHPEG